MAVDGQGMTTQKIGKQYYICKRRVVHHLIEKLVPIAFAIRYMMASMTYVCEGTVYVENNGVHRRFSP
jgi:hypothetical protein